MCKKVFIKISIVLVLFISSCVFFSKSSFAVIEDENITISITFLSQENVMAADFEVVIENGSLLNLQCGDIASHFESIDLSNKKANQCIVANFSGGTMSGTLASATIKVGSSGILKIYSVGDLANSNGEKAANGNFNRAEYSITPLESDADTDKDEEKAKNGDDKDKKEESLSNVGNSDNSKRSFDTPKQVDLSDIENKVLGEEKEFKDDTSLDKNTLLRAETPFVIELPEKFVNIGEKKEKGWFGFYFVMFLLSLGITILAGLGIYKIRGMH